MIRFVLRFCGLLLFAAAFVALVIDGSRTIAAGTLLLTPSSALVDVLMPGTPARWEQASGWIWHGGLEWLLRQPTYSILGPLGLALMLLGRKRRPPLGLKPV
jgi:hypothetical protein